MNYIDWNRAIWEYFFKGENQSQFLVLAASKRVLTYIGEKHRIENPEKDFIDAIREGPVDPDNQYRFHFGDRQLNIIEKAAKLQEWCYGDKPRKIPVRGSNATLKVWHEEAPPYIAYLFFLVFHVEGKDSDYWNSINDSLGEDQKNVGSQYGMQMLLLFEDLKLRVKSRYFYCSNVYRENNRRYVGHIYSQLPLTSKEETELKASLLGQGYSDISQIGSDLPGFAKNFLPAEGKYGLRALTKRFIAEVDSVPKQIIVDYFSKNLATYLEEIPAEKDELQEIYNGRNIQPNKPLHIQFLSAENGKLTLKHGFVTDSTVKNLASSGDLVLRLEAEDEKELQVVLGNNRQSDFDIKTGRQTVYLFDEDGLNAGSFKNKEKDLAFEFRGAELKWPVFLAKETENSFGPVLYRILEDKEIEHVNSDLFVIAQEKDFERDNQNIRYHKAVDGSKNEGSVFEQAHLFKVVGGDKPFEVCGRKIKSVNREVKLEYHGLKDGISGQKSFHVAVPLRITVSGAEVDRVEINTGDKELYKEFRLNEISENESLLQNSFVLDNMPVGAYDIELFDQKSTAIEPPKHRAYEFSFEITDKLIDKRRLPESVGAYPIADKLKNKVRIPFEDSCELLLTEEKINKIIDLIIKTGAFANKYVTFQMLLTEYFYNDLMKTFGEVTPDIMRQVREGLLNVMHAMGYLEVDPTTEKVLLNKPYWWAGAVEGEHYLRGSLTLEERKELESDGNLRFKENPYSFLIYRNGKGEKNVRVKVELPQIICSTSDIQNLPTLNGKVHTDKIEFNEPVFPKPIIEERQVDIEVLKNGEKESFIPPIILIDEEKGTRLGLSINDTNKISYFNWRELRYLAIEDHLLLERLFEYSGIRLYKIEKTKSYMTEYHYVLFEKGENDHSWKYSYYGKGQGSMAKFDFLKKLKNIDFTLDLEEKAQAVYNYLRPTHHQMFRKMDVGNASELEKLNSNINYLAPLQLRGAKWKPSLFFIDREKHVFGVSVYLTLPSEIEKALIANSGQAPVEVIRRGVSVKNAMDKEVFKKEDISEESDIRYRVYHDIPSQLAKQIKDSLIGRLSI